MDKIHRKKYWKNFKNRNYYTIKMRKVFEWLYMKAFMLYTLRIFKIILKKFLEESNDVHRNPSSFINCYENLFVNLRLLYQYFTTSLLYKHFLSIFPPPSLIFFNYIRRFKFYFVWKRPFNKYLIFGSLLWKAEIH